MFGRWQSTLWSWWATVGEENKIITPCACALNLNVTTWQHTFYCKPSRLASDFLRRLTDGGLSGTQRKPRKIHTKQTNQTNTPLTLFTNGQRLRLFIHLYLHSRRSPPPATPTTIRTTTKTTIFLIFNFSDLDFNQFKQHC